MSTTTKRDAQLDALAVSVALRRQALSYEDEVTLHEEMGAVLDAAGIHHLREARLDPRSRIDFLTEDGVGIEVKVAGSVEAVTRQLLRYAASPEVRSLMLVTSIAAHLVIPRELGGKPVLVHSLIGQGL